MCSFIKRSTYGYECKSWSGDAKGKGRAVWSDSIKGPTPLSHSWQHFPGHASLSRFLEPEASKDGEEGGGYRLSLEERASRRYRTKRIAKSSLGSPVKRVLD